MMRIYTIGFTETTAEYFFERLAKHHVKHVVDVRLWNRSQLSGFAKAGDLDYFLNRLINVSYRHEALLAPSEALLSAYRQKKISWQEYEVSFIALMRSREIEKRLNSEQFADACLLCSEKHPHYCHRRLALDYLSNKWGKDIAISHL